LKVLAHNLPPTPSLRKAIDSICDLAAARNVRLLFDAEHQAVQAAIDAWTLESMKKYNGRGKGATVYGTYQAYLKATPRILAEHLAAAREAGFVLGVKLVRGAYLGSDPRNLINDTKEETDRQYDGIAASLMQCSFNNVLQCNSKASDSSEYPDVNVVLASHNELSVRLAQKIRTAQAEQCQPRINLVYAQLMGMADEVSCELLKASRVCNAEKALDVPLAYKYLVWGTTGECMKYLLRRAHENRDAVGRTRVGRDLMIQELWRRIKGTVGLA
jgi:proline dehydrogenase